MAESLDLPQRLFVVVRFDAVEAADPADRFALTRAFWDESEAYIQADRLNRSAPPDTRYFVRLARVSEDPDIANPS